MACRKPERIALVSMGVYGWDITYGCSELYMVWTGDFVSGLGINAANEPEKSRSQENWLNIPPGDSSAPTSSPLPISSIRLFSSADPLILLYITSHSRQNVFRQALHLRGTLLTHCPDEPVRETNHNEQSNPRSTALRAVAKANKLDLEIVHTEPAKGVSTEYLKLNKLGKVPTFEGADGYVLTECMAIAIYRTYHVHPLTDSFQFAPLPLLQ